MTSRIVSPTPREPRLALVTDALILEAIDLITGWAVPIDDRELCVVPGCLIRSRRLDEWGMCPPEVWDLRHDTYAEIPTWLRR